MCDVAAIQYIKVLELLVCREGPLCVYLLVNFTAHSHRPWTKIHDYCYLSQISYMLECWPNGAKVKATFTKHVHDHSTSSLSPLSFLWICVKLYVHLWFESLCNWSWVQQRSDGLILILLKFAKHPLRVTPNLNPEIIFFLFSKENNNNNYVSCLPCHVFRLIVA